MQPGGYHFEFFKGAKGRNAVRETAVVRASGCIWNVKVVWAWVLLHSSVFSKLAELFCCEISTFSFLYYETKKSWKRSEKTYPQNWLVSIRHSAIEQFTDLSFEYVKSVCKIYVLLESKWRHYITFYLIISSFNKYFYVFYLFWNFWHFSIFWFQN